MDQLKKNQAAIEKVAPGITAAYERLLAGDKFGIYTSNGAFYNHTFFGRDAAMSGRFVTDFDHETTVEVIESLIRYQGSETNTRNQEEPGRIHHELRDFKTWQSRFGERLVMNLMGRIWGMKNGVLKTYFASDTTANFIRTINKYCHRIDESLLERTFHGETVAKSVERAADWIVSKVDDNGRFMTERNRHTLPFQTFQDSVTAYAWQDGFIANYRQPHSFLEVQAFGADALEDASRLLSGKTDTSKYKNTSHAMRKALLSDYWIAKDNFFTSLLSVRDGVLKPLDVANISAGWTLNTSWWDEVSEHERAEKITAVLDRLFSDEFLTEAGLRTRSKYSPEPLGDVIDYHGSQTVWPIFNYMVIEGLSRHRMFKLARELENRILNGCNAVEQFSEFLIVDKNGRLQKPRRMTNLPHLKAQMIPEKEIAFTVVPILSIARRIDFDPPTQPLKWQARVEDDILNRISATQRFSANEAERALDPRWVYLSRAGALLNSARLMSLKKVTK